MLINLKFAKLNSDTPNFLVDDKASKSKEKVEKTNSKVPSVSKKSKSSKGFGFKVRSYKNSKISIKSKLRTF